MTQATPGAGPNSSKRGQSDLKGPIRAYTFGPFRLSRRRRRLSHLGRTVALTPKALDTLEALIERRGETVSREELLSAVWPDAFVEEAVLTQNVYTLRKALAAADADGRYVETVPRRGYRFVAAVGEERAAPGEAALPSSLAVLPFQPLTAAPDAPALGLGMADALIARLSGVEGIAVRPTSAVLGFLAAERDAAAIGRRLGVEATVDGTIQLHGERLRAGVQLVSAADGSILWAERFDAPYTDLFEVQDSIARRVAGALELELSADRRSPEVSPAAYEAFLSGRYLWNQRTGAALRQAAAAFERAIALEPGYARAHAGLADTYVLLPLYGNLRPHEAFPRAIEAAARALALAPELVDARTTLAYSRFLYEWSWAAAEEGFRRVLELEPDYANAHHWYAYYLTARGRHERAIARARRARELDPFSRIIHADLGLVLYFAGRHAEAIAEFEATLEEEPDFGYARFGLGMALEATGRVDAALAEARAAADLSDDSTAMLGNLGRTLAGAGRRAEARAVLERLLERSRREYVGADHVAMVYTGLGDTAAALDWWRRALEERSRFVLFLSVWPVLAPLAGEPGFVELARRVRAGG